MAFTIALVTLLFISAMQVFLPYFVNRTVIFGVSIPEQYIKEQPLTMFKRRYVTLSFIVSLICIGFFIFWVINQNPADDLLIVVSTIIQFVIIIISFVLYFYFHKKAKNYKKKMGWAKELKEVKVADLSLRYTENMPPWYIYLLPMFVVIGLIVYTFFQYDLLPNDIPTHWGPNGEPDSFTGKNYFSSIQLLVVLLVMQIMFLAIQIGMKNSGIKLSATNLSASKRRQMYLRKYTSWFLLYTSLLITILFSFLHLETIHPQFFHGSIQGIILLGFILGLLGGTVVLFVKIGLSDKKSDVLVNDPIMDKDDDKFWKGGLFYFNPNDPSIFVEKRFGIGWTINLANPLAYLILLLPIALILIIAFL